MTITLSPIGTEAERMSTHPERYHVWQYDERVLCDAAYRVSMYPAAYTAERRDAVHEAFLDMLDARPNTVAFECDECRSNHLYRLTPDPRVERSVRMLRAKQQHDAHVADQRRERIAQL